MSSKKTKGGTVLTNESNIPVQYRRSELMYLKSYMTWLTMREKTASIGSKWTA
jgi:hypothetical protein